MSEREIKELEEQIGRLRIKLREIARNTELTDPEVVGASQMLDALLNEYEKMIRERNNSK